AHRVDEDGFDQLRHVRRRLAVDHGVETVADGFVHAVGSRARYAAMPPATFETAAPSSASRLAAGLERYPPSQMVTTGPFAASSRARAGISPTGMLIAPSMWPARHSRGERTSTSCAARADFARRSG